MRSSKSPAVLRATPAAASPQPKATRRNFIAPLIDVIGFTVGSSFLAPQAVLQEFVTHLTRSNVLIGLTTSVIWSSTSATQVLVSNHVERLAIKKRYVMVIATFERLAVLLLAILTPFLAATRPTAMLVVLLALMAAHYAMMGCSIPAYSAMITKIVPARQRGILYGLGGTIANALRAGAGLFIPFLVTASAWWGGFPNGFATCFMIGFVVLTLTYIPLGFVDEPVETHHDDKPSPREYARMLIDILRNDARFRLFVASGWCGTFAFSATALYVAYALKSLGAPPGTSGWFSVAMGLGAMSAVAWGLLGDRAGNRVVLLVATALMVVSPLWAIAAPTLAWFYPVVFLTAVAGQGTDLAGYNMQLEFAEPRHVPRYVALTFTALAIPRFVAPLVAGLIADTVGFRVLFALAVVNAVVAAAFLFRMRDPRHS